jgi:hypothetical protein
MQVLNPPARRVAVYAPLGAILAALLGASALVAEEGTHLTGTPDAMIELARPDGWSVGAVIRLDRRELTAGEELLRLDVNYALARVGYAPVPFFQVYGELGWDRADNEDIGVKGESGVAWSAGLLGNFVEYVIRSSPVTGKKETFSLGGELAYRYAESNFPDDNLNWGELIVLPTVQYTRKYDGDWDRHRVPPAEILVRGGVLFSSIDGEYGDQDVEGNRDFALHLATAARWRGSWVTGIYGNFYGSSDRSIGLELAYHF